MYCVFDSTNDLLRVFYNRELAESYKKLLPDPEECDVATFQITHHHNAPRYKKWHVLVNEEGADAIRAGEVHIESFITIWQEHDGRYSVIVEAEDKQFAMSEAIKKVQSLSGEEF